MLHEAYELVDLAQIDQSRRRIPPQSRRAVAAVVAVSVKVATDLAVAPE